MSANMDRRTTETANPCSALCQSVIRVPDLHMAWHHSQIRAEKRAIRAEQRRNPTGAVSVHLSRHNQYEPTFADVAGLSIAPAVNTNVQATIRGTAHQKKLSPHKQQQIRPKPFTKEYKLDDPGY